MSDAFWIAFFATIGPAIPIIVSHLVNRSNLNKVKGEIKSEIKAVDTKVDHVTELSNSMLEKTKQEKADAEKKLEQTKEAQLAAALAKNVEYEKQIALMTNPKSES